ncbi:hypothetical protein MNBD_GAMMA12-1552 [hydrothermal vent metagenome]|uniref:G-protein coupled receptors family 1 profile domain-containing protein n=1 Tax=hydrothermal vent metagenome TaxID=652676 RepID=A0A3B0YK73_9ZZZZ
MLEILEKFMHQPFVRYGLVLLIILLTIKVTYRYTKKPLRVVLLLVGTLMIVFRTAPGTEVNIEGFAIVSTLLVPVLVILILMVLLLDALMAKVMQEETQDLSRYQYATKLNLLIVFVMIVEWIPYFNAI